MISKQLPYSALNFIAVWIFSERQMLVDDLLRVTNVHILRGIISLGKIVAANPDMGKNCMSAEDLFHTYVGP